MPTQKQKMSTSFSYKFVLIANAIAPQEVAT